MDIATPTLPTRTALGIDPDPVCGLAAPAAPVVAAPSYHGLAPEEGFLLPLLAWSDPIVDPELQRVLSVLDWLAEQAPACLDGASLVGSVRSAFARPILELTHRVLLLEWGREVDGAGEAQRGKCDFSEFAARFAEPARRRRIESDYPLLAQQVFQRARQTARTLTAMLRRVVRDHGALQLLMQAERDPGRLRHFRCGLGHRYLGGQSTSMLDFESGQLVYKPKPLAADAAFAGLLGWMAAQGMGPEQRAVRLLDRGDYGYQEMLFAIPATDGRARADYYRRYGGLLAVFYLLGSTRLEPGSLISSGASPVLLDAELVLQPALATRKARIPRRDPYSASVLACGLVAHADGAHAVEAAEAAQAAVSQPLLPRECLFGLHDSAPDEAQQSEPARFADQLCAGFEATYAALLARKEALAAPDGPLAPFKSVRLRAPLRRTRQYDGVLDALLQPDSLRLAERREAVLRRLAGEGGTRLQQLCRQAERAALMRGDVPCLHVGSDALDACDGGNCLGKAFGSSAWKEMQKRLRALSPQDLRRQSMLLRDAMSANAVPPARPAPVPTPAAAKGGRFHISACMAAATDIGDRLLADGFRDGEQLRFRQMQADGRGNPVPMELGTRLYDELAGIALFLGELHVHGGAVRFLRAAERLLQTIRSERAQALRASEGLGGFCGLAGWVYTLAFLGLRWNRTALVEEALGLLRDIRLAIGEDMRLNVAGGAAGALLVLCELDRVAPFRGALLAAQLCAAHLAVHARKDKRGAWWDCADGRLQDGAMEFGAACAATGFARGNAGIAAALGRFGAHAGQEKYLALAREAMRYERSALAGAGASGAGWCCGSAGIGLGRLALPAELRDQAWGVEVQHSVRQAGAAHAGAVHTLGHGSLAELELLIAYAQQFPGKEHSHAVLRLARDMLDVGAAGWRSECGPGYANHGFVSGLAGIGYGLLRVAKPQHVPAVSLLELPHQYGAL